ncbi:MAG TPA: hypothetical protein PKE21_08110 [Flavobacteriales bacterium]|nr:hypothetical protein [Flavobacteriales bacterium]HMR27424.1 hypothetical protein [Flavobacteriales bacterium]
MAREKILFRPAQADVDCIRVRLDSRTIVLIRSMKKFAYWKERYPEAVVIEPVGPEQKDPLS